MRGLLCIKAGQGRPHDKMADEERPQRSEGRSPGIRAISEQQRKTVQKVEVLDHLWKNRV